MRAAPLRSQECKWTFNSGPLMGTSLTMSHPILVIGRNEDCDIVIADDPKCSRKHAKAEWTNDGLEIEVLSKSNALKVNGVPVEHRVLEDGDVITVGSTDIQFNVVTSPRIRVVTKTEDRRERTTVTATPTDSSAPTRITFNPLPPAEYNNAVRQMSRPPSGQKLPAGIGNYKRFVLYGVVALVFIWLLADNGLKKKHDLSIRTQEQIDLDIDAAKKLEESADKMRRPTLDNNFEISHAQENYVKGFRDFRKGQYERALESFQACLSLNPEHVLCNRYLRLAQRKFNELIEYHMVLGRQYKDQEQYRACRAAFRNVLFMVKDPTSSIYREAKANFDACNAFAEGRF